MKKNVIICLFYALSFRVFCQPQIINPTFPSSVGLFDLFEVSFSMGASYSNPYDPDIIHVYALFIAPDNTTCKVEAFYYEGYSFYLQDGYEHAIADSSTSIGVCWKIRFTPTQIGTWRYRIIAIDTDGMAIMPSNGIRNYSFECTSVDNADGFISKANSRYLKKDVVRNGQRKFHSFFPIGPNVSWYKCLDYGYFTQPRGIYFYEEYIDSLNNNANYMRVFINRFQCLSLFGPEYTQQENGAPIVYFNTSVNQKDSAELDYIITYASQHDINIMVSVFTCEAFKDKNHELGSPSIWGNNPFHTILGLTNPCDFFTDLDAKKSLRTL